MYRGLPFKQMGVKLDCSRHTIDSHRRLLYDKVGEHRRDQVLLKITLVGMTSDDPARD